MFATLESTSLVGVYTDDRRVFGGTNSHMMREILPANNDQTPRIDELITEGIYTCA
jgi:hypothetical protein